MYAVNVALGNVVWRLLFRDHDKAKTAFTNLTPHNLAPITINVEDDFGQICEAVNTEIKGLMFEDLDKAKQANVELFLHQQRTQAMATKAAQSDPALRASSMMNGPAVLSPMGGFRPS
ncbi:MAG: hypothetical protein KGL39_17305 [Patescibacteria group bacterium]|nr:hypothetical protein [Patescibacteria group bacterium]